LRVDIDLLYGWHPKMSNLKSTIETLAANFALSIISALRSASIDELAQHVGGGSSAPARRGPGRPRLTEKKSAPAASAGGGGGRKRRRGRRSSGDIGKMVKDIVALLQKTPSGLRSEQIRSALNAQAKELPRPLADGLADGRITKTGQKRATTYFAGSGGGGGGGGAKRGRKKR
jgi:hypothetical protein